MNETILKKRQPGPRKYNHKSDYFDKIDTEAKAYILGFIIADGGIEVNDRLNKSGHISKGLRLAFCNSIDDLEIIKTINEEISPESKLYYFKNNKGAINRKEQIIFRICSYDLCTTLINDYDIIPNKTKYENFSFNFDKIPTKLVRHFIRGFFDGDGSVSFYETKKTMFFNFSFVFNSKIFAEQVGKIFEDLFNIRAVYYTHIGKTCTYYVIRFDYSRNRTEKIKEIFKYLYEDSTIFLTRKKIKFLKYFEYRANSTVNKVEQCNA